MDKKSKSEDLDFLVGEGGFEPPKLKAADLQSVPFGHSGTLPNIKFAIDGKGYYSIAYFICQEVFNIFLDKLSAL